MQGLGFRLFPKSLACASENYSTRRESAALRHQKDYKKGMSLVTVCNGMMAECVTPLRALEEFRKGTQWGCDEMTGPQGEVTGVRMWGCGKRWLLVGSEAESRKGGMGQ